MERLHVTNTSYKAVWNVCWV